MKNTLCSTLIVSYNSWRQFYFFYSYSFSFIITSSSSLFVHLLTEKHQNIFKHYDNVHALTKIFALS